MTEIKSWKDRIDYTEPPTIMRMSKAKDEEIAELRAALAKSTDDPDCDGIEGANPAWWRGHDHTTIVFCKKVNEIIDGKDDGHGVSNEPWDSTRRRLLALAKVELTKEEHAKVLAALQLASGHVSLSYKQCQEVDEAAAIMRKEPEPPTVKESLTVPVVKQSLTTEPISDAEILKIRNEVTLKWYADTSKNFDLMFARALLEHTK